MAFLSPSKDVVHDSQKPGPAIEIHTVPTGVSTVPPSGPAIPDVAIAKSTFNTFLHPCAICATTSSLTTPLSAIVCSLTPKTDTFTSSAYATMAPRKYLLEPGTEQIAFAIAPPVKLSAVPIVKEVCIKLVNCKTYNCIYISLRDLYEVNT